VKVWSTCCAMNQPTNCSGSLARACRRPLSWNLLLLDAQTVNICRHSTTASGITTISHHKVVYLRGLHHTHFCRNVWMMDGHLHLPSRHPWSH
jgi:hypothetical protein